VSSKAFNQAVGDQIGPLLEGILRKIDEAKAAPHPKVNAETEFAARFAVEKSESLEYLVAQETKALREQLNKALAEVKKWRGQVEQRVTAVEFRPAQILQTETVREVAAPRPMAFTLSVTKTDGGLMRIVIARDGDRTVQFTINRTDDGFPSSLTAEEK